MDVMEWLTSMGGKSPPPPGQVNSSLKKKWKHLEERL